MTEVHSDRRLLECLVPLYRLGLELRELALDWKLEPVHRLKLPVVSIGSLSAGGSGKTPLTIALAQALTRCGLHVDVLSRGYGRKSKSCLRVDSSGTAEMFGDEPLLIARRAGIGVFVGAKRYEAGLQAEKFAPADRSLHLLDDGFQHRQLHRDVNLLMVNGGDLLDSLLPAGRLREPLSAIERAHIIAVPAGEPELESRLKATGWKGVIWRLRRRMEVPPIEGPIEGPVVAFCGIARSDQFFAGLEEAGLLVAACITFPDHHVYRDSDLDRIEEAAHSTEGKAFVTTEKDWVRLGALAEVFPESHPLKTARLSIEIEDEEAAVGRLAHWLMNLPAREE